MAKHFGPYCVVAWTMLSCPEAKSPSRAHLSPDDELGGSKLTPNTHQPTDPSSSNLTLPRSHLCCEQHCWIVCFDPQICLDSTPGSATSLDWCGGTLAFLSLQIPWCSVVDWCCCFADLTAVGSLTEKAAIRWEPRWVHPVLPLCFLFFSSCELCAPALLVVSLIATKPRWHAVLCF